MQVRLEAIGKNFGGVQALKGVSLLAESGKVHALVGENGAGKSTLMKILSGVIADYSGKIFFGQEEMKFSSPKDAEKAGVTIIHQELSAFGHLSVAENLVVGHWPTKFGLIDHEAVESLAHASLAKVGATFSPHTKMSELSAGDQQMVEIAKALMRNSAVLIFDEPTSSLSPKESERLAALIRELAGAGKIIFYISHRMEEIFSLTDSLTVLRDGASVLSCETKKITEQELIRAMVGRELKSVYPPLPQRTLGKEILRLENFMALPKNGNPAIGPLSLTARAGEIIGFGGLLGAGRTELLRALLGDENFSHSGAVFFQGKNHGASSLRSTYQTGIGALSEDRKRESILPTLDLTNNFSIRKNGISGLCRWVDPAKESGATQKALQKLNTRFHTTEQKITALSGGNQQKVVLARILQDEPNLILLDEPTRGVDVGAKYEIYELLFELASEGKTILLISSDLPELMALSDRIVVLAQNKVRGELERKEFSQEKIMSLAVKVS